MSRFGTFCKIKWDLLLNKIGVLVNKIRFFYKIKWNSKMSSVDWLNLTYLAFDRKPT